MTGALRYDTGKAPMHLLPPEVYYADPRYEAVWDLVRWFHDPKSDLYADTVSSAIEAAGGMGPIAQVLAKGAEKYAPRNWELGMAYSRTYDCAMRHYDAYMAGELDDKESGLPHLAHYACNVVFLYTWQSRGLVACDDRLECLGRGEELPHSMLAGNPECEAWGSWPDHDEHSYDPDDEHCLDGCEECVPDACESAPVEWVWGWDPGYGSEPGYCDDDGCEEGVPYPTDDGWHVSPDAPAHSPEDPYCAVEACDMFATAEGRGIWCDHHHEEFGA